MRNSGDKIQRGEIIPQDYRRYISTLSPSGTKQSKVTLPQNWSRPRVLACQDCCFWWLSSMLVGKPSNHDSPPPWACSRWTPSKSRCPECQTPLTQSDAGNVWTSASQKTHILSAFADVHCPDNWGMPPRAHVERRTLRPREYWDQAHQWFIPTEPPPHSRCCWSDPGSTHRPDEIGCYPITEWRPRRVHPVPDTQRTVAMSLRLSEDLALNTGIQAV